MKTLNLLINGLILSVLFISCEKSTELDPASLQMDLESKAVKKNLYIGMEYGGGIIFKLDETGQHGLIAALDDLGPAPWGCLGTEIPDAESWGDGYTNTRAILAACPEPGIAARLCEQYVVREKGNSGKKYRDWYLPSDGELSLIFINLKSSSGFCGNAYWTSTEYRGTFQAQPVDPSRNANQLDFQCAVSDPESGGIFRRPITKSVLRLVRPIRAF